MSTRILTITLLAAALAACATTPAPNSALEQARAKSRTAQADPQLAQLAPVESKRADDALRAAERGWSEGRSADAVDHLAYLASQRMNLALETAASRADQATVASAEAQRDQLLLAQRTQQADTAERQLAAATQANARSSEALAVADAAAKHDQA